MLILTKLTIWLFETLIVLIFIAYVGLQINGAIKIYRNREYDDEIFISISIVISMIINIYFIFKEFL